ncbi:hypothetical protein P3T76_012063 [Phytophthora citrophthora]|uniref:Uncharacterized protein n=1 Tax=Phytophthora citrophthora TaxID=4793 RepID=A0AAD9G616_9STRA|nr:hypothetical protein P3T76_012063 [Phytophthora citrophthora]
MTDLAARHTLSAQEMALVLQKPPGGDAKVRVIDPTSLAFVNGAIATESGYFRRALPGATKEIKILCPLNCNNNH